jgi:hypothetical protein
LAAEVPGDPVFRVLVDDHFEKEPQWSVSQDCQTNISSRLESDELNICWWD